MQINASLQNNFYQNVYKICFRILTEFNCTKPIETPSSFQVIFPFRREKTASFITVMVTGFIQGSISFFASLHSDGIVGRFTAKQADA
jgi:hypothetical protein